MILEEGCKEKMNYYSRATKMYQDLKEIVLMVRNEEKGMIECLIMFDM